MLWDKKRSEYLSLRNIVDIDISHSGKYYQIDQVLYAFEDYELEMVVRE